MKILTVVGNRPQFIKAAGVSRHLRARGEEVLVHTGQHYDRELSDLFFEELDVPPPDHLLDVGAGTHGEQTARTMLGLEPLVAEVGPDVVLVYGDTNATLGGALVAAKASVPLAHVEAGMRSFDLTTPEEVNRIVADRLGGLLLCSTPTAMENLDREGLGQESSLVGDVMADVALAFGPVAERRSDILGRLGLEAGSYVLVTAHRAENVDAPERLALLADLLVAVARETQVVFPVHPRTQGRLDEAGLGTELETAGVSITGPVGYLDLTRLLHRAQTILTDSGGLQKEAYLAGVPCLTMRPVTEWTETVQAGWNRLVDLDKEEALRGLRELAPLRDGPPPNGAIYGGGNAGERVAEKLQAWVG
jgi:UDP-N-acetylglucosamine 2-epimerase (non-hydrolysing)/UDP-GlcNAc3NAcA epimerase